MTLALRKTVKVQAGGRIEILASELTEGATAEVIVIIDVPELDASSAPTALASLIGAARGGFPTAAAADEFLRHQRDTWAA